MRFEKILPCLLQGMENALAKQREACPAVAHPFNELQLMHFSLDKTIARRQSQTRLDRVFVLQLAYPARFDTGKPLIELLTGPRSYHLSKLLDQLIRLIDLNMQRTQQGQRFLFVSFQFFRPTKEKEHRLSCQERRLWRLLSGLLLLLFGWRGTSTAFLLPFWNGSNKPPIDGVILMGVSLDYQLPM